MNTEFSHIDEYAESPSFWDERYNTKNIPWDLDSSNPAFEDLLKEKKLINPGSLLIPGCGRGFDAISAAKAGFNVTALDFSKSAIKFAKTLAEKEGMKINFITQDIFSFNVVESFDTVYDCTMYCSVNPKKKR